MGNAGSRSGSSSTPPTAEAYFSAADAKILRELFAWLDDGTTDLEATTAPSFMHACICTGATSSSTTSSDALAEKLLLMREVNVGMFSPDAVAAKERTASAAVDRFGQLILNLSPETAQARFRLVPGRMRETDFWYLYFCALRTLVTGGTGPLPPLQPTSASSTSRQRADRESRDPYDRTNDVELSAIVGKKTFNMATSSPRINEHPC